ncbi:MAG: hypothetical protein Q8R07_03195 [Candidatus Uhrbacteria bacterium]|nr:hypothetical protein [Candidatus Uhrbacteria bacterium]
MRFIFHSSALVARSALANIVKRLDPSMMEQGIAKLPFDRGLINRVLKMKATKVNKKLKYVIVIGIGGSNLGAKAVYDAVYGSFDGLAEERYPKMLFLDTTDPEFLFAFSKFFKREIRHADQILVNVISKSGTTTESVANAEWVMGWMKRRFKNVKDRFVITTDEGSKLWKLAEAQGLSRLSIPKMVGGRYSVFTAAGLFPLAAIGLDIRELCRGAREATQRDASVSASIAFHHLEHGRTIYDHFFFHPELETLGKWVRQLVAESLGKHGKGLTPTVTIGSTDLHSVGQLLYGGPRDKFTNFIWAEKSVHDVKLPRALFFRGLVEGLPGQSAQKIMQAILHGAKKACRNESLPFSETILPDLSLRSLGGFLQCKMMETMFLGKLMKVNAFDQPAVELYKKETRRILKQS